MSYGVVITTDDGVVLRQWGPLPSSAIAQIDQIAQQWEGYADGSGAIEDLDQRTRDQRLRDEAMDRACPDRQEIEDAQRRR